MFSYKHVKGNSLLGKNRDIKRKIVTQYRAQPKYFAVDLPLIPQCRFGCEKSMTYKKPKLTGALTCWIYCLLKRRLICLQQLFYFAQDDLNMTFFGNTSSYIIFIHHFHSFHAVPSLFFERNDILAF